MATRYPPRAAEVEAGIFYRLQQAFSPLPEVLREDIAAVLRKNLDPGGA